MNIFVLDYNPQVAAQYHCDKHIVKMIVESCQMLCTAHWVTGSQAPYKRTHVNHPCSIWVRESLSNYDWLCQLTQALLDEYEYRYGKQHKSASILEYCMMNKPCIENKGITQFALAMPDVYKAHDCVAAYRSYYNSEKKHIFNWKNRQVPHWVVN